MSRILLILPTRTYRAPDFVDAARRLGVEVVVASEERQAMAEQMGERALEIDLRDPVGSAGRIVALAERTSLDAVVPVDEQGVVIAAEAATKLGLAHNAPEAVRVTRDKGALRRVLTAAGLAQPDFRTASDDGVAEAAMEVGLPVVVKAPNLAASRGVIRADTPADAADAAERIRRICAEEDQDPSLVVERYVPGTEVALEGLLRSGELEVLAVFDKPDPLEGPYFEETIYVTPSRLPEATLDAVVETTRRAVAAIGLTEGPIHAELRLPTSRGSGGVPRGTGEPVVLEVGARSIGGLCARSLTFGLGMSLEEVILRHALGRKLGRIGTDAKASGVMMIPIPAAGVLEEVGGQDEARAVGGIVGLEITIPRGDHVRTLPEGDRYLGFLFARGDSPDEVENALRLAHERLDIRIRSDR